MPGKGAYWKKGGLIDETVKEEDLSQALQAKVNSGGYDTVEDEGSPLPQRSIIDFQGAGVSVEDSESTRSIVTIAGGGGGDPAPTLDQFVWHDEMIYNSLTAITDHYAVVGSINPTNGGTQGSIEYDTDGILGDGCLLTFDQIMDMDFFQGDDITFECSMGGPSEDDESVLYYGFLKNVTASSATISENRLEVNNDAMCGFIRDPAISSNWRLISRQNNTSTAIQTTIDGNQSHKFKLFFDKSVPSIEFFIDGVSRGTITTNVCNESSMIPELCIWQTVASPQQLTGRFWKLIQPRA